MRLTTSASVGASSGGGAGLAAPARATEWDCAGATARDASPGVLAGRPGEATPAPAAFASVRPPSGRAIVVDGTAIAAVIQVASHTSRCTRMTSLSPAQRAPAVTSADRCTGALKRTRPVVSS